MTTKKVRRAQVKAKTDSRRALEAAENLRILETVQANRRAKNEVIYYELKHGPGTHPSRQTTRSYSDAPEQLVFNENTNNAL